MRGKFITFEGIDGSGGSTQLGLLYDTLIEENFDVIKVREPGGTAFSEELRNVLKHGPERTGLANLLTFEATRAEVTERVIAPALKKGKHVLADRYYDSTLAYQGFGECVDLDQIRTLNEIATDGLLPDLTLLYDVKVEEAKPTDMAYFEKLGIDYQRRVREGYLELAGLYPERIKIIKRFPANTKEESIDKTFHNSTLPTVLELLSSF